MNVEKILNKTFENALDKFEAVRENKELLLKMKRASTKYADAVSLVAYTYDAKKTVKAQDESGEMHLKVAINTTNWLDSHDDVHLPGLWNKSVKENPTTLFLKEHKMEFDNIISDAMKTEVVSMPWTDLGFQDEGTTEVLLFNDKIYRDDNPEMYDRYAKGRVHNHSVGMQYFKIFLALNSDEPEDAKEKAAWDKYYPYITNKEKATEQGYFFAVTEAKKIEGSAVPMGSNERTPTIEAGKTTSTEPDYSTLKETLKNLEINLNTK